jgi:hypothetical protein
MNCWVVPRAILGLTGVTAMDTRVAAVTVSVAVPVFAVSGSVAVIVIGPPTATGVANPLKPSALLTVAIAVFDELQVTADVRFRVVRSEYIPVATNGWFVPRATLALTGVTVMDDSVAAVTLSVAVPAMSVAGSVAVIVIGPPAAFEVASPSEPTALLMVATTVFDELQITVDVRFCVVRSEYVPVAINCGFIPRATLVLTGVTPMDTSVAAVTVSVAVAAFAVAGSVAVIVIGPPTAFEVATPFEPAVLLMVATAVFEDVQVTDDVRSCVVASE